MVQQYRLEEKDYRGERFADFPHDLKGNIDLLSLTRPDIIRRYILHIFRQEQTSLKQIRSVQPPFPRPIITWKMWYTNLTWNQQN